MKRPSTVPLGRAYSILVTDVAAVLEAGRGSAVCAINSIMSAVYWEIGRRIVQFEQAGRRRAAYRERVIEQLSIDLKKRFGAGFGRSNLFQIRAFYVAYEKKVRTLSGLSSTPAKSGALKKVQTLSGQFDAERLETLRRSFPLPWSHYVRLLSIKNVGARDFYESEALRNGWSVRQLDRQIATRFFERTALSKNKAAMLAKGGLGVVSEEITPEQAIKDPYVLEFLRLKDEYSENDLEEELIRRLEEFLMELGGDFAFIGRQKRLRIGDEWFRIDLLFFHRRLRSLVVIDLKVGKFSHADAGQMHLYLNYARENWTNPDENPPVGLILCSQKDSAVAKYALDGLPNKIMASEYKLVLPNEGLLVDEIAKARKQLEI